MSMFENLPESVKQTFREAAEFQKQMEREIAEASRKRRSGGGGGAASTSGGTSGGGGAAAAGGTSTSNIPPRPTQDPGPYMEWFWDGTRWVRRALGGLEDTSKYRPGQRVGGPDRVTPNGGAVVDGVYIPPGTFGTPPGGGAAAGGATGDEDEVPKTTMPIEGETELPPETPIEEVPVEEVPVAPMPSVQEQMLQAQRESAMDLMRQRLDAYGLGSLADFVWNLITQENITSEYALVERIRQTEQYKQRFPAMKMRRDNNLNAISEQEYINLENAYRETMKIAGMPRNLFDTPEDFTALISGDVSAAELKARVNQGYVAVAQSDPQVIREMKRLYGVDDSMLAAYFLDPERTTPMLLRQAQAAQIAGEAALQAEMGIAAATAEQLAVAGVTQETARQGFQTIAATEELFVPLPGTTEQAISQEEQIAGVFGTSAAAQQRIRQRSRERQAAFQQGGTFAGQGTTVTGLQ